MKKSILSLFVILAAFFALSSCGGGTPAVELSPEMTEFVGMIKGTSDDVTAALEKFGSTEDIQADDMGMYDLKDPVVTAKNGDCYSVEFTAGITTRMYDICWADGKIATITDKGMK
ncbi:MAG: hypothetical protein P1P88_10400 [Bacteroidales bacterium]|nr:hypothetical protein [Bacteroidales bacterium]